MTQQRPTGHVPDEEYFGYEGISSIKDVSTGWLITGEIWYTCKFCFDNLDGSPFSLSLCLNKLLSTERTEQDFVFLSNLLQKFEDCNCEDDLEAPLVEVDFIEAYVAFDDLDEVDDNVDDEYEVCLCLRMMYTEDVLQCDQK